MQTGKDYEEAPTLEASVYERLLKEFESPQTPIFPIDDQASQLYVKRTHSLY
jgi:hypothetical protein